MNGRASVTGEAHNNGARVRAPHQATSLDAAEDAVTPEMVLDDPEPAPASLPAPGARVGQYEIIRELGRGGMGAVFAARDTKLGRKVAIKFLSGDTDPEITARFILEAKATARCSHENIIVIYEVGDEGVVDTIDCDLDCTTRICGDGHRNAIAGEQCDQGMADTAACDSDCTDVVCGDNHLNTMAGEPCDDGNTSNNDSCVKISNVCKVATCGDGFINMELGLPNSEICDPGNPFASPPIPGVKGQCGMTQTCKSTGSDACKVCLN